MKKQFINELTNVKMSLTHQNIKTKKLKLKENKK